MLLWWATLLSMSIIFFPITSLIFKNFHDKGWIFGKVIGVAISSWLMWYLSYMKIMSYTILNCFIIILVLAILNIVIGIKLKSKIEINKKIISNVLTTEIIFFAVLLCWVYIRGFLPNIEWSSERFMDYGFMKASMETKYMPPQDIWFSGNSMNYYYFGQYISGFICKIADMDVGVGYQLMVATIASFTFIMPYILGYNLGRRFLEEKDIEKENGLISRRDKIKEKLVPVIIGVLAGTSICIGCTLYYPIYRFLVKGGTEYYYWNPVRYIGYDPETNDKTITEIPAYSSVLGDLHAHYVDLIFAFTTLALILQLLFQKDKERKFPLQLLLLGFLLGLQKMTNYWNFPIYLVIISISVFINNFCSKQVNWKKVIKSILQIIIIVLIEEIVSLPFTLDLDIGAAQVKLTGVSSPLQKWIVLWGFQTLIVSIFLIWIVGNFFKKWKSKAFFNSICSYIKELNVSNVYVAILGICAIGLVIVPEILYLKDIYSDEFKRANTMFKLTYQGYVLFSICISYILVVALYKGKVAQRILSGVCILVLMSTFGYGVNAISYTTNKLKNNDNQRLGITEYLSYVKRSLPDDVKAIEWILENIDRDKIILESTSGSYNPSGRISVFTSNPTVLGWHGHEWIWRADENYDAPEEEAKRWNDVPQIYFNHDAEHTNKLIDEYGIDYIYFGNVEHDVYSNVDIEALKSLGEVVYEVTEEECINTPVYIIKVGN